MPELGYSIGLVVVFTAVNGLMTYASYRMVRRNEIALAAMCHLQLRVLETMAGTADCGQEATAPQHSTP